MAESGLQAVPLDVVKGMPGSVSLTFDDGYCNFRDHALPLLVRHRLPATLFVVSGYCGRTRGWRSQAQPAYEQPLLSWEELREIADAGVTIGAHTVHHYNLISLPEEQVVREMHDCRIEIEDRIGRPVNAVAYPYGFSNARIRQLAEQEFQIACGTRLALVNENSDSFDLPRIFDFYLRSPFWLGRLNRPDGRAYIAIRKWVSAGRDMFRFRSPACI